MGEAGRGRVMCLQAKDPRRCQPPQQRGERLGRSLSLRGHQPADTLAWASPPPPCPVLSGHPGQWLVLVSFLHPQSHIPDQAPALT